MLPSNWQSLAGELGIELNETGKYCRCPLCANGTVVFTDDQLTHKWYQCLSCCNSGSLFDFVSKLKQIPITSAATLVEKYSKLSLDTLKLSDNVVSRTTIINQAWAKFQTIGSLYVTTAANVLLGKLHVSYLHQSWHALVMDHMFRMATGRQLTAHLDDLPSSELKALELKPDQLYLISRTFTLPGQLGTLMIVGPGARSSLAIQTIRVNLEHDDPGFGIHPNTASSAKPIIMLTSLTAWLRMSFFQLCGSADLPATALVLPETRNQFIPRVRKSLIWTAELDSQAVEVAKRFGDKIVRIGANNGTINQNIDKLWPASNLFEHLNKFSRPWIEHFKDNVQRLSSPEVISLLTSITMTDEEQSQLLEYLPPHIAEQLSSRIETLPMSSIYIKGGVITQCIDGWKLESRGVTQQLTNMPFRIVRLITGKQLRAQVEVYLGGRWESFVLPYARLCKAPFKVLTDLTVKAQLKPFQADSSIAKNFLIYAERLNPILHDQTGSHELGFDLLRGVLKTSRLKITANPFSVEPVSIATESNLLSYADGTAPDPRELSLVLSSRPIVQTLNCLVLQTLRYMLGSRPLAVVYGPSMSTVVMHVLRQLEVLSPHWPCDFTGVDLAKINANTINKLRSGSGIWTPITEDLMHWLSMTRPTLSIGFKPGKTPDISERALQRTYIQLLTRSLRYLSSSSCTPSESLTKAWQSLLSKCDLSSKMPAATQPISTEKSLAHWLRRGLEIGYLKQYGAKPKDMRGAIIVGRDNVQFMRDDIPAIVDKLKLPAVNIVNILAGAVAKRNTNISFQLQTHRAVVKLNVHPDKIQPRISGDLASG